MIPYFEPVVFQITDGFAVHGFGVMVALAFVIGSHMAMKKAARDGLDPELINRLVGWLVVAVFVGGHLGHIAFYDPQSVVENPMYLFKVWDGLSSFGGMIGCLLITIWFFRREGRLRREENRRREAEGLQPYPPVNYWDYGECCAYGWSFGWVLARIGCFVAHDHPGTETKFVLGVKGMTNPNYIELPDKAAWLARHADQFPELATLTTQDKIPGSIWQQIAYHDLGLYEAIWSFCMGVWFFIADRKPRFSGFYQGLWCLTYGITRIWYDGLRTRDNRWLEGVLGDQGVTPGQVGSLALIALGVWVLTSRRGKASARERIVGQGFADPVADREAAKAKA